MSSLPWCSTFSALGAEPWGVAWKGNLGEVLESAGSLGQLGSLGAEQSPAVGSHPTNIRRLFRRHIPTQTDAAEGTFNKEAVAQKFGGQTSQRQRLQPASPFTTLSSAGADPPGPPRPSTRKRKQIAKEQSVFFPLKGQQEESCCLCIKTSVCRQKSKLMVTSAPRSPLWSDRLWGMEVGKKVTDSILTVLLSSACEQGGMRGNTRGTGLSVPQQHLVTGVGKNTM